MALKLPVQPDHRREQAISGAQAAVSALAELGVTAVITGSLARDTFGPYSDVDFLITDCPRHLKYAIEGTVEDALGGLPFDVVYLDEIPASKVARFAEGAVDACDLR
jgi:predicted nucleotidyltransferase